MTVTRRVFDTAVAAAAGWCLGWVAGTAGHLTARPADYPFLAQPVRLPHHVPKDAGGVAFRFAMAHDVIHERFARHGPDHYRERDRVIRAALRGLPPDGFARFALLDDLGVGLDRLGRSDEAAAVLREKLDLQRSQGISDIGLYTTYANLGTFLIHGNARGAAAGDPAAVSRFREGVAFVRKSVEVNPRAHFGRERWQAAVAEFLLAAAADPALLRTFDCLGNRLDLPTDDALNLRRVPSAANYGRPYTPEFGHGNAEGAVPAFFEPGADPDDPSQWARLRPIRLFVTKVGAEEGWRDVAVPSHREPVPFDEPALGVIGMWRQGGGANPHFALALGETMLRVGQRFIAWSAFERAARLADGFSASAEARAFLRGHVRARQAGIENSFEPATRPRAVGRLRRAFDDELAYGRAYQKSYQDFEAAKLAAGGSVNDPHFFDDFSRRREPIASPMGPEEWHARVPDGAIRRYQAGHRRACGVFGAGLLAFVTAGLTRWLPSRSKPLPALSSGV